MPKVIEYENKIVIIGDRGPRGPRGSRGQLGDKGPLGDYIDAEGVLEKSPAQFRVSANQDFTDPLSTEITFDDNDIVSDYCQLNGTRIENIADTSKWDISYSVTIMSPERIISSITVTPYRNGVAIGYGGYTETFSTPIYGMTVYNQLIAQIGVSRYITIRVVVETSVGPTQPIEILSGSTVSIINFIVV